MQLVAAAVDHWTLVRHGVGTLRNHPTTPAPGVSWWSPCEACLAAGVLRRRKDPTPVDPLAHVRPDEAPTQWRSAVRSALAHRARFGELRDLLDPGPTRDRVDGLAVRVDAGVLAVWDLVQRGVVAERVLRTIDPDASLRELKDARRQLAEATERGGDPSELARHVEAVSARHRAAQRVWNEVDDLDDRLSALDRRLGAVVANVAELAAGTMFTDDLDRVAGDLDAAVESLAATRAALDELS
jgi:hypothetical protein